MTKDATFASPSLYSNPAMNYSLPSIPEEASLWRLFSKPCDGRDDEFLPEDFSSENCATEYERQKLRQRFRDVAKECKNDCPFLTLCSREALMAARTIAEMQGSRGRLYGIWAGEIFRSPNGRADKYDRLLSRINEQATEEVTWEPSKYSPTAPPWQSASRPSARDTSGQNSAMTTMSIPA